MVVMVSYGQQFMLPWFNHSLTIVSKPPLYMF